MEFLRPYFADISIVPFITILVFYILSIYLFSLIRKKYSKVIEKIYSINPNHKTIKFDNKFLISKSSQIFLQQILLMLLISVFQNAGYNGFSIILISTVLFALSHMHKPLKLGKVYGVYLIACSIFIGFVSSALILFLPYGIIYSFIIHWYSYIFTGLFVLRFHKKRKLRKYILPFILQI